MSSDQLLRGDEDPQVWFFEHFGTAADEVIAFLDVPLSGKAVADIGCGDGIIDLGLVVKGQPTRLVGYDVRATDVDALRQAGTAAGVIDDLPEALSFVRSEPDLIPAGNDEFDIVVTWSVFEHVDNPVRMFSEIERVLKPDGILFLQLWPFFYSEHGGHLWPHYDEPFPHLLKNDAQIRQHLNGRRGTDPSRDALNEYDSLNRLTADQLQAAISVSGLSVSKLELIGGAAHIPRELTHLPLTSVGIGGVKLLAVPTRGMA
jgi:SAM-dependent methyltransferase